MQIEIIKYGILILICYFGQKSYPNNPYSCSFWLKDMHADRFSHIYLAYNAMFGCGYKNMQFSGVCMGLNLYISIYINDMNVKLKQRIRLTSLRPHYRGSLESLSEEEESSGSVTSPTIRFLTMRGWVLSDSVHRLQCCVKMHG